ncbi:hypothetical protein HK102_009327 [Quaeritorhiza haematococci]|nr:hypothetical protein HK102_009327 [Quaeritorhiza haematococci]
MVPTSATDQELLLNNTPNQSTSLSKKKKKKKSTASNFIVADLEDDDNVQHAAMEASSSIPQSTFSINFDHPAPASSSSSSSSSQPAYNTSAYVSQAQAALDNFNPHLARQFLLRALQQDPTNLELLVQVGTVEMDILNASSAISSGNNNTSAGAEGPVLTEDQVEELERSARSHFLKAAEMEGEKGFGKFLYLGQLSMGFEAVGFYERGCRILQGEILEMEKKGQQGGASGSETVDESALLRKQFSSALCSLVEIFMTDCCEEPDAEARCEAYISEAIKVNPNDPEVYQTLASIRISQSRPDDAKAAATHAMDLWWVEPTSTTTQQQQASPSSSTPATPNPINPVYPPYSVRMSLSKLLIELGLYERAMQVLKTLQQEDDEDADLWYVYGWCYYLLGEPSAAEQNGVTPAAVSDAEEGKSSKVENWDDACDCFYNLFKLREKGYAVDPDLLGHAEHLLKTEIIPFLTASGHPPQPPPKSLGDLDVPFAMVEDDDAVMDEDDDGGWEDVDSDDDEMRM